MPVAAEDWNTADGKTYHNVIVVSQEDDGLRVTYTGGAGKIVNYELPPDIQKKYGLDYASLDAKRLAAEKALAAAKTEEERAAAEKKLEKANEALKLQREMGQNGPAPSSNVPQANPQNAATTPQANPAATIQPQNNAQNPAPSASPQNNPQNTATTQQPRNPAAPSQPQNKPQNPVTPEQPQTEPQASGGMPGPSAPEAPSTSEESETPTPPPASSTSTAAAPTDYKTAYPGSKYSYDDIQDFCYLDSAAVDVWAVSPDAAPTPAGAASQGTLTLRITTPGAKPESPDEIEATFRSNSDIKHIAGNRKIRFLVDGNFVSPQENTDESGAKPDASQPFRTISFNLDPQQLTAILKGKLVNFSVGTNDYKIDETGIAALQKYLADVNHLPPASFNFFRAYHHFVNGLPSIITVISTICEYVILGGFGIVMAIVAAAFCLGVSKFMKM